MAFCWKKSQPERHTQQANFGDRWFDFAIGPGNTCSVFAFTELVGKLRNKREENEIVTEKKTEEILEQLIGWAEFYPDCITGTYPWVQWLWNPFKVDWAIATAPEVKNQGKKGSEKFEQRLSLQFHYQIEKSEVDLYETLKP